MIIAGTGHRPDKLGVVGDADIVRLAEFAGEHLRQLTSVTKVISGMAEGWDLAIAAAAIVEGIPLICAVPFYGHGVSGIWTALYSLALERAREVVIVTPGGYEPYKMQKRNRYMVDNSTMMLALWNGTRGGTYNCLQYAKEKDRLVINAWPKWKECNAKTE